jgi:uncharacterized membrane protein
MTGGFATRLLLSTGQNREIALFGYVAILDLTTLVLAACKPWRRLLVISYAGTLVLFMGWYFLIEGIRNLGVNAFSTVKKCPG